MNLNELKECSICHSPLTEYGNKFARNGVVCRECAKKLSPFLDDEDIANKTIYGLKLHLRYRERNAGKLDRFLPEEKVEGKYNLQIDKKHKTFMFNKRNDLHKENPDIIRLRKVKDVEIETRQYLDNPDAVDVIVTVPVKSTYLNKVSFRVNEFPGVARDGEDHHKALKLAEEYKEALLKYKGIF